MHEELPLALGGKWTETYFELHYDGSGVYARILKYLSSSHTRIPVNFVVLGWSIAKKNRWSL